MSDEPVFTPEQQRRMSEPFVGWMLAQGAPEHFVLHYVKTGGLNGTLWPIRWPIQRA
jgi:hypothetical protein